MFEAPTPPLLLSSLDYSTLICSQTTFLSPSPPSPPLQIIRLLLFFLHLLPLSHIQILHFLFFFSLSSYRLYLPLLQLLLRNIRLISPHLPSQDLCFFSPPFPPLLPSSPSSLPLFFLPAPVLFAPVYLHRSTRWFVLKLHV